MTRMWTALHTICCPNVVLAASPNWTSSLHIRDCSIVCSWEDGPSRLIYDTYYPNRSIFGQLELDDEDLDSATHNMLSQCGVGGQPKLQIGPPQYIYEVVVSFVVEKMVWAGWFTFPTIPNKVWFLNSTRWRGFGQRYTRYVVPMWCWRPAQIGPPQYI